MAGLWVFVAIGGAVIVLAVLSVRAERKRRETWSALAPTMGLEYLGAQPIAHQYPAFKIFTTGRSQRAPNLLRGASGRVRVTLGDYEYVTGSGKNRTTHRHTLCVLERDGLSLPHCFMRPQMGFLDAIGKLFGGQDINFDDDPAFSKAYVLQGLDEEAIRQRFDRPSRAWLAARSSSLLKFEACGDTIVFLAPRMDPEVTPKLLDDAISFLMLWA